MATALITSFYFTNTGPPVSIVLNALSSPQTTQVDNFFPQPLLFQLLDAAGNVATPTSYTLQAPTSGPSGFFLISGTATVTELSAYSGNSGHPFVANDISGGPYAVVVTCGTLTATFILTNQGIPVDIGTTPASTPQTATIGASFAHALGVVVQDYRLAPIPGLAVTFTAPSSGPSGLFLDSANATQVTTDSSGTAFAPFQANLVAGGPYTVSASTPVPGGGLLSLFFTLTNSPTCDVDQNGSTNALDVKAIIDQALGVASPADDLNGDGVINVRDIQLDIMAGLKFGCATGGTTPAGAGLLTSQSRLRPETNDTQVVDSSMAAIAPPPAIAMVVSAADFRNRLISPGEVVTLSGTGLGPAMPAGKAAASLGGVQVYFDQTPALLTYLSATQINCVAPREIPGKGLHHVTVTYRGQASAPFPLAFVTASPALFTANGSGSGPAAALNQDQTYNSPASPAIKGSTVVFFLTGVGPTRSSLPVSILIGGQPASGVLHGEVPGVVSGVSQLEIKIPPNAPSGNIPVSVSVGGNGSQDGVTVSVR